MNKIHLIGMMDNSEDHTHESINRVYGVDGISPTLNTFGGGDREPKILVNYINEKVLISENSKD